MQHVIRLLLFSVVFIMVAQMSFTQSEQPTLRELADMNNLHFGAALYSRHLNEPMHAEILGREFNMLTHEQEAKPCEIQTRRGRFNFNFMDELIEYAEAHDMDIHGHTLIWHSCTPDWINGGVFEREEAIGYLRDYIMTVVGRYKGRIPVWDVVNEGIDDDGTIRLNAWQRLIGDDYIDMAFQFAHEADPDAILLYNDYGISGLGEKSDAVYEMAQGLVERGVPIHGIGIQGHFTLDQLNPTAIRANMQRFADLGLEVQFTEVDVRFEGEPDDEILRRQAVDYRTLVGLCLEMDACTTFIVWGVSDRFTWLRSTGLGFFQNPFVAPLLYDDDYQPKPAYFAVLDLLAREAGQDPILSDDELDALLGD